MKLKSRFFAKAKKTRKSGRATNIRTARTISKKKVRTLARRKFRRHARKSGGRNMLAWIPPEIKTLGMAYLYAALVKKPTEDLTRKLTSSVGLNLADNGVRIVGNTIGRRTLGKMHPLVREVFDTGLAVEGAELGKNGISGLSGLFSGQTSTQTVASNENKMQATFS